jgi:hypothetical protein
MAAAATNSQSQQQPLNAQWSGMSSLLVRRPFTLNEEPSLDELLAEPIMARDGVDEEIVRRLAEDVCRNHL